MQESKHFQILISTNSELEALSQRISDVRHPKRNDVYESLKFFYYISNLPTNDFEKLCNSWKLDNEQWTFGKELLEIFDIFNQATKLIWNDTNFLSVAIPVFRVFQMSLNQKKEKNSLIEKLLKVLNERFSDLLFSR